MVSCVRLTSGFFSSHEPTMGVIIGERIRDFPAFQFPLEILTTDLKAYFNNGYNPFATE